MFRGRGHLRMFQEGGVIKVWGVIKVGGGVIKVGGGVIKVGGGVIKVGGGSSR